MANILVRGISLPSGQAMSSRLALSLLACVAAAWSGLSHAQQQPQTSYSAIYARGFGDSSSSSSSSAERAEAARILNEKIQALRSSGADPAMVELKAAQYEFYLAALEAVGKEELIRSAVLRQGERAQGELYQVGKETKRLSSSIESAVKK